ncbi:MAG: stage II sporulation protein P [Paenibacillus sp.]|uniref:stage II sporulation protein P n=1 Tax=Paenibacillus sp. TaxID=58172 RepID=UPI00290BE54C|nr:stage II sporulation protein P [Paenibacillus sp.]MDU4698443.1 stage II sporulation protein P [Paenibacillus sp.]
MKFKAWNLGKMRRNLLHVLALGRTFLLLSVMSVIFFIMLGVLGIAEKSLNTSPVSSMKGLAASLSSGFFMDMVGMELPHVASEKQTPAISGRQMTNFVFQLLTDVNPSDPKSLVAREVPGLGANSPILLRTGSGNGIAQAPEDYRPGAGADGSAPDHPEPDADEGGEGVDPGAGGDPGGAQPPAQEPGKTDGSSGDPGESSIKPGNKNIVMIYHSHPQESYNPVLGTNVDNPSSAEDKKNVGLVGEALAKELERKGVAALHSFENYAAKVSNYNYNYSYKYSRETVKQAMAENGKLQYFIDIHRDSQRHDKTTTTIDGVNYAQVYFIIGHGNENWRENERFASSIHDRLEKAYPGISRGIWGKTSSQGNGEYNQSLSPNSVLIEIGGIDNSAEELERTAKVLAGILADLYWESQDAEKAGKLTKSSTNGIANGGVNSTTKGTSSTSKGASGTSKGTSSTTKTGNASKGATNGSPKAGETSKKS